MENNVIDTAVEENLSEKSTSSMEDGFVRSLATIHKNLKYSKNLREQAIRDGMRTLKQDGIEKIFKGLTDYEQLLRIIAE